MKKLKKIDRKLLIVFLLSLVMVSSCSDDFIDVDPTEENSEDFFNTEADYQIEKAKIAIEGSAISQ